MSRFLARITECVDEQVVDVVGYAGEMRIGRGVAEVLR
jgi:hypothetical protein